MAVINICVRHMSHFDNESTSFLSPFLPLIRPFHFGMKLAPFVCQLDDILKKK
jgi:hypothetical protein